MPKETPNKLYYTAWKELTCLWSRKQDAIFSCCWCIRCLWRQIWECVHVCMLCIAKSFLHFLPCIACSVPIFLSSFLVFSCRWNLFFFLLFFFCFLSHLLLLSSISKFKQPMTYILVGEEEEEKTRVKYVLLVNFEPCCVGPSLLIYS